MKQYDFLIVGAGLFGAVFAERARAAGRRCLVVEKRPHVGGNAHTEKLADIWVHRYGPHIFHTNDEAVWDYVRRFARFNRFTNAPLARCGEALYSLPFNMHTFYQLWGVRTPAEAEAALAAQRAGCARGEPANLEEQALALVGRELYEKLIKGYTEKQWGRPCRELPPSIIKRLPLRLTFDTNYYEAAYQGVPVEGYTALVAALLEGTELRLSTDYLARRAELDPLAARVVYTGPIDALFDYRLGELAYRGLHFETQLLDCANFQGNAVVNYTDAATPYTRIIEHKHFVYGQQPQTVLSYEYPRPWRRGEEAYYPINDSANDALYARYRALADARPELICGGRLAEYRYYDMDQVVAAALKRAGEALREA